MRFWISPFTKRFQPSFVRAREGGTAEPRFNEPLYNEVLGMTNDIFQP